MNLNSTNSTQPSNIKDRIISINATIAELSGHRWTSSTKLNALDESIKKLMTDFKTVDSTTKQSLTDLSGRISTVLPKTTGFFGCIKYIFMRSCVKEAARKLENTAESLKWHPELLSNESSASTSNFGLNPSYQRDLVACTQRPTSGNQSDSTTAIPTEAQEPITDPTSEKQNPSAGIADSTTTQMGLLDAYTPKANQSMDMEFSFDDVFDP